MISGLQKMTLLDFPGKVACTVFLGGCNFRCPFCHNSHLFDENTKAYMEDDAFFTFLESRKGLLDGVCVSGGEPTMYSDIVSFIEKIKHLGFAVKLDTNGSRPDIVKVLTDKNLVDYIAMDVKNSPSLYLATTGTNSLDLKSIEETLKLLINGKVQYELRTTLVNELHNEASIKEMGEWLSSLHPSKKPQRLYLQSFIDRETVVFSGLTAPESKKTEDFSGILSAFVDEVIIRNK